MRETGTKPIASNRQARRNYEILVTIEAGIVLRGSEVKSLRDAKVQLTAAFGRIDGGEIWLHGLHLAPYLFNHTHPGHDPAHKRKLMLKKPHQQQPRSRVDPDHLTHLPLTSYLQAVQPHLTLALTG